MKRKIKIFKVYSESGCSYCDSARDYVYPITEWDEVTEQEYQALLEATRNASQLDNNDYHYFMIEQSSRKELLQKSSDFLKQVNDKKEAIAKKQREREAAAKLAAKEKEEKKIERKKKQLAKLTAELSGLK